MMAITNKQSQRLIRLPLWIGLTEQQQILIVKVLEKELERVCRN
jgi:dTDP-4-amino-4,6-dideoxygalactose transaminase